MQEVKADLGDLVYLHKLFAPEPRLGANENSRIIEKLIVAKLNELRTNQ